MIIAGAHRMARGSPKPTWIAVLDSTRMRIFERAHAHADLNELTHLAMTAPPPHAPRRRLGRVHDRFGPGRHAVEPRTAPGEAAEARFNCRGGREIERLGAGRRLRGAYRLRAT